MRLDQLVQLSPRRCAVDLGEEPVTSRELLVGGVIEVGKTALHDRLVSDECAAIVSGRARWRNGQRRINQRFPKNRRLPIPPNRVLAN